MSENPRTVVVGMLEVNCYLVQNPGSDTLYIVDPGGDPKLIERAAKSFVYKHAVILFTHAHVDHIFAAGNIVRTLNVSKVYIHPDDLSVYYSPANALIPYIPAASDLPSTLWPLQDPDIEVIHTPGHSPGGVCYYFKKMNLLFSGDTLFQSSIGRTDLPGGDMNTLLESIRSKLLTLPENLTVYPGHGSPTTIGSEQRCNPYL